MRDLLQAILKTSARSDATAWLEGTVSAQKDGFQKRPFYYSFSGVSRHFDKRGLVDATESQLAAMDSLVPGFSVSGWDQFRLARVILLLVLADQDRDTFLETVAALLNTADLREQAAIFSAFPLLPHQETLVEAAIDGLRSNIIDIFDSIALQNPFPAAHFPEEAWNQMVLKALFINRPVYRIEGVESRSNAELSAGISYLAHERWAAGRKLSPEAWRNCAGFITGEIAADIARLIDEGDEPDREAAALLVASDDSGQLLSLLDRIPAELNAVAAGTLSWESLGGKLEFPTNLNGSPSGAPLENPSSRTS